MNLIHLGYFLKVIAIGKTQNTLCVVEICQSIAQIMEKLTVYMTTTALIFV